MSAAFSAFFLSLFRTLDPAVLGLIVVACLAPIALALVNIRRQALRRGVQADFDAKKRQIRRAYEELRIERADMDRQMADLRAQYPNWVKSEA